MISEKAGYSKVGIFKAKINSPVPRLPFPFVSLSPIDDCLKNLTSKKIKYLKDLTLSNAELEIWEIERERDVHNNVGIIRRD